MLTDPQPTKRPGGIRRQLAVVAIVSLVLAACGSSSSDTSSMPERSVSTSPSAPTTSPPPVATTTTPPVPDPPVRLLPPDADVVFAQDYSAHPVGPYGLDEFDEDYGSTNSFGIEQGRAEIGIDPTTEDWTETEPIERHLRMTHPAGAYGPGRSGVSFNASFADQDEVIAEWIVYLEPGWSWGTGDDRGGKLGGLSLGPGNVAGGRLGDGSDEGPGAGGSVRLTWTGDGAMVAYVYHLDQRGDFGDKFDAQVVDGVGVTYASDEANARLEGEPVYLDVGRWQAVALHVKVNTPGRSDGEVDLYQDGERVLSINGLRWRGPDAAWGISGFMHGFFYGGATDSYAPADTSYSRIADIRIAPAAP